MEGLAVLAILACPVGMGLMMWFMSKRMKRDADASEAGRQPSVEELRRERARLESQIERAERERAVADGEPLPR
jgi:hypothetical protein